MFIDRFEQFRTSSILSKLQRFKKDEEFECSRCGLKPGEGYTIGVNDVIRNCTGVDIVKARKLNGGELNGVYEITYKEGCKLNN